MHSWVSTKQLKTRLWVLYISIQTLPALLLFLSSRHEQGPHSGFLIHSLTDGNTGISQIGSIYSPIFRPKFRILKRFD